MKAAVSALLFASGLVLGAILGPTTAAAAGLGIAALATVGLWVDEARQVAAHGTQAERVALNDVRTIGDPQDRKVALEALQRAVDRAVIEELNALGDFTCDADESFEASKLRHPSGGAA